MLTHTSTIRTIHAISVRAPSFGKCCRGRHATRASRCDTCWPSTRKQGPLLPARASFAIHTYIAGDACLFRINITKRLTLVLRVPVRGCVVLVVGETVWCRAGLQVFAESGTVHQQLRYGATTIPYPHTLLCTGVPFPCLPSWCSPITDCRGGGWCRSANVRAHNFLYTDAGDADLKGTDCLFTGDGLFVAGCGRVFEGTHAKAVSLLHAALYSTDHIIRCVRA